MLGCRALVEYALLIASLLLAYFYLSMFPVCLLYIKLFDLTTVCPIHVLEIVFNPSWHLWIAFPVYKLKYFATLTMQSPILLIRSDTACILSQNQWNSHLEQFSVQYQIESWIEPSFRLVVDLQSHSHPAVSDFNSQRVRLFRSKSHNWLSFSFTNNAMG